MLTLSEVNRFLDSVKDQTARLTVLLASLSTIEGTPIGIALECIDIIEGEVDDYKKRLPQVVSLRHPPTRRDVVAPE